MHAFYHKKKPIQLIISSMAKKKEISVEEKLRSLFDLQIIDSRIDEIRNVRGELPLEVEDLESEIAGMDLNLEQLNSELNDFDLDIKENKNIIESANDLIAKYADKLKNVRNNREYNSIVKEEEYQQLEIQLAEKKIKELKIQIEQKKEIIGVLTEQLGVKTNHLTAKKEELDEIMQETAKEETLLMIQSAAFEEKIDDRLIVAYKRIRGSVKNGLAIVPVERGASGGSYFTIPPQIQMEIASRKKIITDEYSGRILVDAELAEEEYVKINKLIKSV
ncbi:MAG: putative nucleic acid-binding Zn-ribbon protein [Candidatus Arcticimaribacter sp.]